MNLISIDKNIESFKINLNKIINQIREAENKDVIDDVLKKVKLAREWIKIQNKIEELYSDILRIEIEYFKKIAEDYKNQIPDKLYQALSNYKVEITD